MSKSCSLILAKTNLEKRLSEVSTAIKKKKYNQEKNSDSELFKV